MIEGFLPALDFPVFYWSLSIYSSQLALGYNSTQFRKKFRTLTQSTLTQIGERLSAQQVHKLNAMVNYLEAGRWLKAHGYENSPRFKDRFCLYTAIGKKIENEKVLYLGFGVWRGVAIKHWCQLLKNPQTSFHGFDSFEGLPEDWNPLCPKGAFDVSGTIPQFDDPRVAIHKGWFDETLPDFILPERDRLVLNIDSDLYSSAKCVLDRLSAEIVPGTILMFDEFSDRCHEMKAFSEFLEANRMRFRFLGGTTNLNRVAFERVD